MVRATKGRFFLTCVALVYSFAGFSQQMSGEYTIGASDADFSTISEAVGDLKNKGMSGDITFSIKPGVYQEKFELSEIEKGHDSLSITFRSTTQNPEDVLIRYRIKEYYSDRCFVVHIDDVNHVRLEYLSFETEYNWAKELDENNTIWIEGESRGIEMDNCIISTWRDNIASRADNAAIRFTSRYRDEQQSATVFVLTNSKVIGGVQGFAYTGFPRFEGFWTGGVEIRNNSFLLQRDQGLAMKNASWTKIVGNHFKSDTHVERESDGYTGILLENAESFMHVEGNTIRSQKRVAIGIRIVDEISNPTMDIDSISVINNDIYLKGESEWLKGIQFNLLDTYLLANNSVLVESQYEFSKCLEDKSYTLEKGVIVNNHFIVPIEGTVLAVSDSVSPENFKSNNLFNNGETLLAAFNGQSHYSIGSLLDSNSFDNSSISRDPQFLPGDQLICRNDSLLGLGTPWEGVDTDINGESRSETQPDIGAYEGGVKKTDVSISQIAEKVYHLCPGEEIPVYVRFYNQGTDTVNSLELNVYVDDSLAFDTVWNGEVASRENSDSILLGNLELAELQEHTIRLELKQPNGQADDYPFNNSAELKMRAKLSGTYFVGQNGDFPSLRSCAKYLNEVGVCGPVVLELDSLFSDDHATFYKIPGSSGTNTLSIQPKYEKTTITDAFTVQDYSYYIRFAGTEYCTLSNISFSRKHTRASEYDGGSIYVTKDAHDVTIRNCHFKNDVAITLLNESEGDVFANITIDSNVIDVVRQGIVISSVDTSGLAHVAITNNQFSNCREQSIYVSGFINAEISENDFTHTSDDEFPVIELNEMDGNVVISRNHFASTQNVLHCYEVNKNSERSVLLKNNMILSDRQGVFLENTHGLKLFNNSFYALESCIDSEGFNDELEFVNNIFYSAGSAPIFNLNKNDDEVIESDYNAFYPPGRAMYRLQPGYELYSFEDWKASSGNDSNGFEISHAYISDTNLHINDTPYLKNVGKKLNEVVYDFDGELRDSLTDIGADEYMMDTALYRDLRLVEIVSPRPDMCEYSDSLIIAVANVSHIPINSFKVRWLSNGSGIDSMSVWQEILPGDTLVAHLGWHFLPTNTSYRLSFEVSYPNFDYDANFLDNEMEMAYSQVTPPVIFEDRLVKCDFLSELYIMDHPSHSLLWSTGETEPNIYVKAPGVYSVKVSTDEGCEYSSSIEVK